MGGTIKYHLVWRAFGLVLTLFIVLVGVQQHRQQSGTGTPAAVATLPEAGYRMPPISLSEFPSGSISMQNLRGKPVFINFWTSWCTYCRFETPDVVEAYKKYHNKVVFVSINVTSQDSLKSAEAFMKHYGISWPVALDKDGIAAQDYHVVAFPASFFVNRQGIIVDANPGPLSKQTLVAELERISG